VVRVHFGQGSARWACIRIPLNVEQAFGSKARVAVRGTVNGSKFRSSIFPDGSGSHSMMVNKTMRDGAKVDVGYTVTVTTEPDTRARTVTVLKDLKVALARLTPLDSRFSTLSYSHQREYVDWMSEAKKPETRKARIAKTLRMLTAGKRPKERPKEEKR
jgi:hypothetical protein